MPHTPGPQDSTATTPAIEELKYEEERPKKPWFGYGWRGGARIAFFGVCFVLVVNTIFLVFITTYYPKMGGFPVIFRGTCTDAEFRNRVWHLVINALSTALLAASNYCMQLLCAPNRSNIDRAHAQGVWLDIGIPSIRNLRFVSWWRRFFWIALCFSSIPLHLVYNSTFYAAIASRNYNILYATPEFATGGQYDTSKFPDSADLNVTHIQQAIQAGGTVNGSTWKRLDNNICVQEYAEDFVTRYRNVVAVVTNSSEITPTGSSILNVAYNELPPPENFDKNFDSFAWICDDPQTPNMTDTHTLNSAGIVPCSNMAGKLQVFANTWWRSGGYDIAYCLAEELVPDCHLHFSPHLMGPVVLMNIIKCLIAFYVAYRMTGTPLVTIGDAIESFIKTPDASTRGMCLATAQEMAHQFSRATNHIPVLRASTFDSTRYRWYKTITKRQWVLLSCLFIMMIAGLITGLVLGIQDLEPSTLANAWSIGLGTVQTQNLVYGANARALGASGVLVTALAANAPQAMLSFLYMVYNTIFTLMHIGENWDMFGAYTATTRHRLQLASKKETHRYLRVSDPKGNQKATHFLNLPYRYAIPLIIISGLLHWLMSQTLYLANISVIPRNGSLPRHDEITTVAYAPRGMIGLLILAIFMIVAVAGNSLRRFGGQMPIVSSNSAAIAAACHVNIPERRRRELVLRKIAWGEVPTSSAPINASPGLKNLLSQSKPVSGLGIDSGDSKDTAAVYMSEDFSDAADRDGGDFVDDEYQVLRGQAEMVDLEDHPIGKSTSVSHCTFSDGFVFKPEVGKMYA